MARYGRPAYHRVPAMGKTVRRPGIITGIDILLSLVGIILVLDLRGSLFS